jgi:hypothetical protein
VKHPIRYLVLLISCAFAVFATSLAAGQGCPCDAGKEYPCAGAVDGYGNDGDGMMRPDLIPSGPMMSREMETGIQNNIAACSGPFCDYACRSEGVYFSAETIFIDVAQLDTGIGPRLLEINTPAAPAIGNLNPSIDATERLTFGYQTCDGLGVQARYWDFDNGARTAVDQPTPTDPNFVREAWHVSALDVEVVKNTMINQIWDTSLTGGYRFGRFEEGAALELNNMSLASIKSRYVGNGVTGSVVVRRQMSRRFSLMADGRTSLLFGSQTSTTSSNIMLPHLTNDTFDARYTLEGQLGGTYEHPICGGGYWFVRGGYEIQYWNDSVIAFGSQADPGSTILHGFLFAIGLQR